MTPLLPVHFDKRSLELTAPRWIIGDIPFRSECGSQKDFPPLTVVDDPGSAVRGDHGGRILLYTPVFALKADVNETVPRQSYDWVLRLHVWVEYFDDLARLDSGQNLNDLSNHCDVSLESVVRCPDDDDRN